MSEEIGRELEWDEVVEKGSDFIVFPEGVYDFRVESVEHGRSKGTGSIPPCKMAIVKIRIFNGEQSILVTEYLTLWSTLGWKISEFFISIGGKVVDGRVLQKWNEASGSTGRCKVIIEKYKDNDRNKISKFLPPEEKKFTAGKF